MENASDFDNKDSNHSEISGPDSGSSDEKLHNGDDIKAWDSANEHLLRVLRLTTTRATRSVLLQCGLKHS